MSKDPIDKKIPWSYEESWRRNHVIEIRIINEASRAMYERMKAKP